MSKSFAQDLGSSVAALITVRTAAVEWQPMTKVEEVATIVIGVDGAHLNTLPDGWRQGMAGTAALYNIDGERLETLYVGGGPGATPPQGKAAFFAQMDLHIENLRQRFPTARVVGLSDGAQDLQSYLGQRTDEHLLDFHHAAEYISLIAPAFAPRCRADTAQAKAWASEQRHQLRDQPGAALSLLEKVRKRLRPANRPSKLKTAPLTQAARAGLEKAEVYFTNNLGRMDYAGWQARQLPIGSGVTEAACKTLIKQRLCQSGMRWSIAAADALLTLRALYLTPSHWDQFWSLHNQPTPNTL